MGKKINLTGQRFGQLLVLEEAEPRFTPSGIKRTMWKCKCDCGNIKEVDGNHLKSGHTSSCGCKLSAHHEIDIGTRFGKLTVLEYVTGGYKCQCDCGNIKIALGNDLRAGHTQSCGCLKSRGEMLITNWLVKHNVSFKPQYCCLDYEAEMGRKAYFDFAIFNNKNELVLLVEYNGSIHYEMRNKGWNTEERLRDSQARDALKLEYCHQHGIPLLIIPYWDQDKLDSILTEAVSYKKEGD